jgi:arginine/ornithine N-succinyltransferase beta subunit
VIFSFFLKKGISGAGNLLEEIGPQWPLLTDLMQEKAKVWADRVHSPVL